MSTLKYFFLCSLFITISELSKFLLDYDRLIYNSLIQNFSSDQVSEILNFQSKWKGIEYVFIPLYLFLKISIITSVLYIGVFFTVSNSSFKRIFNIVIKAEFIFLLIPIFKTFWFYFFQSSYTIEDIQYFYPLSALNIIGYKGLDTWLLYPLQTLNLIEVTYIIYLSYQIGYLTKTNADNGLKIVSYSYVPALLLWVTVIMFFTLNYS